MKLNNHQKGVALILLSTLFFGISSIAVKTIPDVSPFQRIFFMNLTAVIFMFFWKTKNAKEEIYKNRFILSLRAFLGFISTVMYFYAISNLQLADATLLNKTSPFFVSLFSVIFLKEKISISAMIAMVIAGVGAVLVINPSFDITIIPALVGVLSGAAAGGAYTIVRKLNNRVHPNNIVFYFMIFSMVASVPFMLIEGFIVPTVLELVMMMSMGIALSLGQIALSFAYKFENASKISIYAFAQILLSVIVGILLFAEIPTATTLIGGFIIFAGGYINYRSNLKLADS